MGRMTAHFCACAFSLAAAMGWGQDSTPTTEQAAISDTLASDTIALSAEESLHPELSSAELAWLGYLDENWCFSSDTSLLNIAAACGRPAIVPVGDDGVRHEPGRQRVLH